MTIDELVEMFLVGHLEEHADQLEAMRASFDLAVLLAPVAALLHQVSDGRLR